MKTLALEDTYTDIIAKAQRGFKLSDEALASRAGLSLEQLRAVLKGSPDTEALRCLARSLNLGKRSLVAAASGAWSPEPITVAGLAQLTTTYGEMTVNSYLAWEQGAKVAVAFDTGADCGPMLECAKAHGVRIELILLTHTHPDHIADLDRLMSATGAEAWVGALESIPGTHSLEEGKTFALGQLQIEARLTSGHSPGGMTYVVSGLARKVAVVGDAIFAGSMGGGNVSYLEALAHNRRKILLLEKDTVLCPGHGPMTTVGEEQAHNPFFPEFQKG